MLDLNGKLLDFKSKKFFSFRDIISYISGVGEPTIVSSDVSPPPRLVQRVSSTFGARLYYPPQLITADKKASFGKSLREKLNDHEIDAYTAATIAYEKFKESFEKIDSLMEGDNIDYADEAKEMLVKSSVSIREAVDSINELKSANTVPHKNETSIENNLKLKRALEDKRREVVMLRRLLNFYKKYKSTEIPSKSYEIDQWIGENAKLENELNISKQRSDKNEEKLKSARLIFSLYMKGWLPSFVSSDFKKESLNNLESYEIKDRWVIFLNNSGISRDALSFLESKGIQGIVCQNNKMLTEFKYFKHVDIEETEFSYFENMGVINPSSMKNDLESIKNDFIKWARKVSDA